MSPTFASLGVPEFICRGLARRGITEPFEIQAATITDALDGRDVCGRAPTGSGKTLAFGIPLVAGVQRAKPHRPQALILAPTRELAEQIYTELDSFSGKTRIGVVYGGVGYGPQLKALRNGVEILVACPGRLEDLIERRDVNLSEVNRVVLDEADRMADMGFMPAVRRILDQTRSDRQTLLFSATLDGDVAKLTRDYQDDPVRHEIGEETPDVTSAHHVFWNVTMDERTKVTAAAIDAAWPTIVFCRTRHGSDRLAKRLKKNGIKAAAIHGGRSQNQRTRALDDFSSNRVHALVATDVAARGIHVDGVASVIHYDPPEDHKTYVHRSGRTARAGEGGIVISLLQSNQVKEAKKVQRQVGLRSQITDADPSALSDLGDTSPPPQVLAPERSDDERSDSGGKGSHKSRKRRGGHRGQSRSHNRPKNRGGNQKKRSGGKRPSNKRRPNKGKGRGPKSSGQPRR